MDGEPPGASSDPRGDAGALGDATRAVRAGLPAAAQGRPFLPGPTLAAPFHLRGDPDSAPFVYARYGNPTLSAF